MNGPNSIPLSSAGIVAIITAIGAVALAPFFKLLFDRVAAGDKAWEDRVKKLEDRGERDAAEIAELRGRLNQLYQMINERDLRIATLTMKIERLDTENAELKQTIGEQDLLNEKMARLLKDNGLSW